MLLMKVTPDSFQWGSHRRVCQSCVSAYTRINVNTSIVSLIILFFCLILLTGLWQFQTFTDIRNLNFCRGDPNPSHSLSQATCRRSWNPAIWLAVTTRFGSLIGSFLTVKAKRGLCPFLICLEDKPISMLNSSTALVLCEIINIKTSVHVFHRCTMW